MLSLSYRYAGEDYLFCQCNPVLNRDAQVHTLAVGADWQVPGTPVRLQGGFFHTWNFAKGSDFVYQSNGFFVGMNSTLPWKLYLNAFYSRSFDHYRHLNTAVQLDSLGSNPLKQHDVVDTLSVHLERPLGPHLSAYLEYDFNRDDSNVVVNRIGVYDYEQHIFSGGLTWRF